MRPLIAAFSLGLALVSCASEQKTTPPASTTPPVSTVACPATINIGPGNVYSPSSCTVKSGTSVTISASGAHPLSGKGAGQTVTSAKTSQTLSFTTIGVFDYVCDVHVNMGMAGKITVEP